MRKRFLGVFILLLFVIVAPVAFADEEVGDVASAIRSEAPIPPGHFAIIAKYADRYLSGPVPGKTIQAAKMVDGINDFMNPYDDLTDFHVLDIRSVADYGKGHIPGAVNVPFALIAKPENLVTYPTDKPILVVCYSGHTASMTTGILNTMGYDVWALRGGMSSWPCSTDAKPTLYQCVQ